MLETLLFSSLATSKTVTVGDNSALAKLSISAVFLATDAVHLENNPLLKLVDLLSVSIDFSFTVTGDHSSLGSIRLPALERVDGSLNIGAINPSPQGLNLGGSLPVGLELSFPSLASVSNGLNLKNCPFLSKLSLPALVNVTGGVSVERNPLLINISIPSLRVVSADVVIIGNSMLETLLFSSLATSKTVTVGDNSALVNLSLANLQVIGDIHINSNPSLAIMSFPELLNVTGGVYLENNSKIVHILAPSLRNINFDLTIIGNHSSLSSLGLPALELVKGSVNIAETNIVVLSLPFLTSVSGGVIICNNRALVNLTLPALVTLQGGPHFIKDNIALAIVSMPVLVTVNQNLNVRNLSTLAKLDLTSLEQINGSMVIEFDPLLVKLDLPVLRAVHGSLTVAVNSGLKTVSMPALELVTGALSVSSCSQIEDMVVGNGKTVLDTIDVQDTSSMVRMEMRVHTFLPSSRVPH
jgi:hypothetical protein